MYARNEALGSLIVLALALCLGVPASAQDLETRGREFGLQLEELAVVQELDLSSGSYVSAAEEASAPVQVASLTLTSVRSNWREPQVLADHHVGGAKDSKVRRAGRWLKKRWWVTTLVGLAVAVAVLEPFDDDDSERRAAQMQ